MFHSKFIMCSMLMFNILLWYLPDCWMGVHTMYGRVTGIYRISVYIQYKQAVRHPLLFRVVFWDIVPCKMIVDRRFRGTYCLHHQGSLMSTHLWNVGRQSFYTAVYPRRQLWTSYSLPWELEISQRHPFLSRYDCRGRLVSHTLVMSHMNLTWVVIESCSQKLFTV
jgi:hypothetical protein